MVSALGPRGAGRNVGLRRQVIFARFAARALWVIAVAAALAVGSHSRARAAEPGAFSLDLDHPTSSLPTPEQAEARPMAFAQLLMQLSAAAEEAEQREDLAAAVRYYGALGSVFAEQAKAFSKLCEIHEELGDREAALGACRRAITLPGARQGDFVRLGKLILGAPGRAPSPEEVANVEALVAHLEGQGATAGLAAARLHCDLALRLEQESRLAACIENLDSALRPDHPEVISLRFALALAREDVAQATEVLQRASRAGLPDSALSLMRAQAKQARSSHGSAQLLLPGALALLLTGLAWWLYRIRGARPLA